jgi:hypothetical protein
VRAGAIIPMGPIVQHTGERPLDEITLLIYPGGLSRFEMYEDDGRSNAYRQGRHAVTAIECAAEPGRVVVRIGAPSGDRSVMPAGRRYLLRLRISRPLAVSVDGHGELTKQAGVDGTEPGWWIDREGFTVVRLAAQSSAVVTVRTTS